MIRKWKFCLAKKNFSLNIFQKKIYFYGSPREYNKTLQTHGASGNNEEIIQEKRRYTAFPVFEHPRNENAV